MARYTDNLVATLRQRYEQTDQTMHSIAAEFDIGTTTLRRLVNSEGWSKRSERPHDRPVAVRLLEEAKALAVKQSQPSHSRESGNPVIAEAKSETPGLLGPRRSLSSGRALRGPVGGDDNREHNDDPLKQPTSPIDRLEALVVEQIEAAEAARTKVNGKRRAATASERNARTLATLTQTLRTLHGMRAGNFPHSELSEQETLPDGDLPRDIDEFRRDLARRIDAFVASRTDAGDAGGNPGAQPLDEAG